jgi:hypothetical protein
MTILINAIDSQFAASTGSNVNSSPDRSKFDYPPTSTNNLTIESHAGDETPFIFSPGDTYTVSFTGHGAATIQDATVVRSDIIGAGPEHAIVFEGLDENGDLTQVVWTPEMDLEAWYFDNFVGGQPPEFYNTDMDAGSTYQAMCFEAAMRIDTPSGPRCAQSIRVGDFVMTHDAGAQPVKWVVHRNLRGWGRHAPVVFEDGVIGNAGALVVSQQHRILIHAPEAHRRSGRDGVLVPAVAFVNGQTVRLRPANTVTYVHLLLEHHHILTAQNVPCESLLLGKVSQEVLSKVPQVQLKHSVARGAAQDCGTHLLENIPNGMSTRSARPCLGGREGARLIAQISGAVVGQPKMLVGPGRSRMSAYHLKLSNGLDHWSETSTGLPAFAAIVGRHMEPAL